MYRGREMNPQYTTMENFQPQSPVSYTNIVCLSLSADAMHLYVFVWCICLYVCVCVYLCNVQIHKLT